ANDARGVGSYGLLCSLMALGMVAGSLAWARWHPQRGRVKVCFAAFGVGAVGIILVALSPWYWLAAAAVVWRGAGIGVGVAAWMTLLTELVPERLLSRVYSLDFFGSSRLTPGRYPPPAPPPASVPPPATPPPRRAPAGP